MSATQANIAFIDIEKIRDRTTGSGQIFQQLLQAPVGKAVLFEAGLDRKAVTALRFHCRAKGYRMHFRDVGGTPAIWIEKKTKVTS